VTSKKWALAFHWAPDGVIEDTVSREIYRFWKDRIYRARV
jgi:hypothetical protein